MIEAAEQEEELGMGVETVADAVEDGCEVFTEVGVIETVTVKVDFGGGGEEAGFFIRDDGHDLVGEFALEEIDESADLAGALFLEVGPLSLR